MRNNDKQKSANSSMLLNKFSPIATWVEREEQHLAATVAVAFNEWNGSNSSGRLLQVLHACVCVCLAGEAL